MPATQESFVLTLNAGSSSVKFSVYRMPGEQLLLGGSLERIGLEGGRFRAANHADQALSLPDHDAALRHLFGWLPGPLSGKAISAVGHRVVQGGPAATQPTLLTPELVGSLRQLIPLAPNHLPSEIAGIDAVSRAFPALPQAACFDTAFHRAMPEIARRYPLPRRYFDEGLQRYGFHGLSYQYIAEELRREGVAGRVVIAHLGNGASMAALRDGQPVDTTMGLTPLGGLMMSTRAGDLDPGVVLYLLRERKMGVQEADDLLNKQSGLQGVSGTTSDMKDLLDCETQDSRAAEAVALFCRQACKHLAAMAVSAGGLDTLVFTGGMGEHSAPIRARLSEGIAFLGVKLDPANGKHAPIISPDGSTVTVRVIPTNEERMIARQTFSLLSPA